LSAAEPTSPDHAVGIAVHTRIIPQTPVPPCGRCLRDVNVANS
jgi:hypothetical protein